jgi:putative nucleotidyltransferase with HDIG domain
MIYKPDPCAVLALPGVKTALELADREGHNLYLVGGAVRDLCLRKKIKDIDLIFDGKGQNFAHTLAARLKSRVVILGQAGFQTYRIPLKNAYLDVWDLKNTTLREDLWRRDFTINAVALHLHSGVWIDPTNGLADLDGRILRRVGPGAFREDPLRLLRGIRLKCQYPKFAIEPSTLQDMLEAAHLIERVAPERVLYEMDLILSSPSLDGGVMLMEETRLLSILLPEMEGIKGISQYPNNPDDVFQHTLNCLHILPAAVKTFNKDFAGRTLLKKEDQLLLAWALLLHDLGKSNTQTEDASGKVHFYNHQRVSMKMGEDISRRLRFSRERSDRLQQLIFFHSRPMQLILSDLPDRGVRRFIHQCRHLLPLQLAMFLADRLSRPEGQERTLKSVRTVWARYLKEGDALIHPPKLVSGEEVMNIMDLQPSPQVGRILDSLLRLQVAGEVTTREDALAYLQRLKAKRRGGRMEGGPQESGQA